MLNFKDLKEGMMINLFEGIEKKDEVVVKELGHAEDFLAKKIKIESRLLKPGMTQELILLTEISTKKDVWVMIFNDGIIEGKKSFSNNSPCYTLREWN